MNAYCRVDASIVTKISATMSHKSVDRCFSERSETHPMWLCNTAPPRPPQHTGCEKSPIYAFVLADRISASAYAACMPRTITRLDQAVAALTGLPLDPKWDLRKTREKGEARC